MHMHIHVLTHAQQCVNIHMCVITHMPKEVCVHITYSCVCIRAYRSVCMHTHTCTQRPRKLQGGNRRKARRTLSQENTEGGDVC